MAQIQNLKKLREFEIQTMVEIENSKNGANSKFKKVTRIQNFKEVARIQN